ncbi:uncharacterized protein [Gossypium hirsutum]|uniref:Mitochondrial protein n=1 Tax=Gossypium hirsutum TaxID=3635 RepID=A0ABM3ASP0_GOSHI|nr:uncharacterized protein LOC121222063 [Gossypium hirsutum]
MDFIDFLLLPLKTVEMLIYKLAYVCIACQKGKSHNLPFTDSTTSQSHHSVSPNRDVDIQSPAVSSHSAIDSPFLENNVSTLGPSSSTSLPTLKLSPLENDVGALNHNSNTSSPTLVLSITTIDPPQPLGNTHHMITRSKADIFKPKALVVTLLDCEPYTIDEAFAQKEWRVVAQYEYDALIQSRTWELVPLPLGRKAIGCKWLYKIKRNLDGTVARRKVYVDDIIITGDLSRGIDTFVQQLHTEFSLKDMGSLHYFFRVELALSLFSKNEGILVEDPSEYRSIAGALQYVILTRPNIAHVVNRICQFMHAPMNVHFMTLKRVLRYLCGTIDYGLLIQPSERLSLVGYVDANWGNLVSCCSKKQQVVSCSITEAEYRGLAAVAADVTCVIAVAANPVLYLKFKHVELDLFFVREKVADGSLIVGEYSTRPPLVFGLFYRVNSDVGHSHTQRKK